MIFSTVDDFYLNSQDIIYSPSVKDDISPSTEAKLRHYGCHIICESCKGLGLPQTVACTAQVLLHRYYCKESLKRFDVNVMAVSMFWLACKLEEVIDIDDPNKIRLRDVLVMFYHVTRKVRYGIPDGGLLDIFSLFYARYKDEVVKGERHALRQFGFVPHVEHAHPFTLMLGAQLGMGKGALQHACNIINDSLRTTLCVRFRSEYVACAAIVLAGQKFGKRLPNEWWTACGVSTSDLIAVCKVIVELYTKDSGEDGRLYVQLQSHFLDFTEGNVDDSEIWHGILTSK